MAYDADLKKSNAVKGNKKIINAWAMYDWANSVYSLTITTAVFPIYFMEVTSQNGSDMVHFLGRDFKNSALYSYSLSIAFLFIALLSPLLSAIADSSGSKKGFMKFFAWAGSIACAGLFFFDDTNLWLGVLCFIIASIGYSGSIVFYNSYLPEIAAPEDQDRISAKGYALGYIGSSILLIFNLVMIMKPALFGIAEGTTFPARFSFLVVGLWWIGFSAYTFYYLPSNVYHKKREGHYLLMGYKELIRVFHELKNLKYLTRFLFSFFFYNMGVQTVMYVATIFGEKEIHLGTAELIITVLIIQFVAIGGAYLFSFLSSKFGNIKALMLAICVWIGICIGAYNLYDPNAFYVLAFVVGMVMGGIQSLSRSTYSKMLPETQDHASYFSFYDVCDKIGLVLGTASYGLIEEISGSMRNSVLALILFFIVGLLFLLRSMVLKSKEAESRILN
ncbi:MAG TPA: MFS transporter [Bacteroidia bacterium]|nr:MFS transporter [Bacteroidia bacterium]